MASFPSTFLNPFEMELEYRCSFSWKSKPFKGIVATCWLRLEVYQVSIENHVHDPKARLSEYRFSAIMRLLETWRFRLQMECEVAGGVEIPRWLVFSPNYPGLWTHFTYCNSSAHFIEFHIISWDWTKVFPPPPPTHTT